MWLTIPGHSPSMQMKSKCWELEAAGDISTIVKSQEQGINAFVLVFGSAQDPRDGLAHN